MINTLSRQGGRRYPQMGSTSSIFVGPLLGFGSTPPTPVVITANLPDTHDGFGGHVNRASARDEKAHRLDREEVRRRLEAAFAEADVALAPVAATVEAKATTIEAETPSQLANIGAALESLAAIERIAGKLAKAEAKAMKEYRKRLSEAEEELALLMVLARMPWL